MKRIVIYIFLFVSPACSKRLRMGVVPTGLEIQVSSKVPKELFTKWLSSHEEDKNDGINIFHDKNYVFPLSRFRVGYEFFEDGKFIEYSNGPDDRPVKYEGQWIYDASTKSLDITFNKFELKPHTSVKKEKQPYTLTIADLKPGTLKVKIVVPKVEVQKDDN